MAGDDLLDEARQVGRLTVQTKHAHLGQRQGPEVIDQPGHHARLLEDRYQMRLVGRVEAVQDSLERALHDSQRGPQLVADVGEQAAT